MDNTEAIKRGEALASLKLHPGYKILIDEVIYSLYSDALQRLEKNEDVKARAIINAVKEITDKIDDTINFSKQAANEFKEKLNAHTQTTSD